MSKYVPFQTSYDRVKRTEKYAFLFLTMSALSIFVLWATPLLNKNHQAAQIIAPYISHIKTISYVFMVGYITLEILGRILFREAERMKLEDLIDNSFETNYSDERSLNYYNNEEIPSGIKKLAVNTYESSFHTESTLQGMILNLALKLLFFSVPFVFSIFDSNGENIVRLLFEISIPTLLLNKLITTLFYFLRIREINNRFKIELINIKTKELGVSDFSRLLNPVMDYYNTKSWANVHLSDKIFQKNNEMVSKKWLKRKETIGIV